MTDKRFKVAFSFAGEKRDFIEKTAELLKQRFGQEKILYDKYHEAEFARYDLGTMLPKLYGEQSELIIPVLCSNYDSKRWTGWEWLHIYGLLIKPDAHRVLLSRFDYAEADGLGPTAAFVELDKKTPEDFARLILERLAINQNKPREYYLSISQSTNSNPSTDEFDKISDPDPEIVAAWCNREPVFDSLEGLVIGNGGMIVLHGTDQQLKVTCLPRRLATQLTNDRRIFCKAISLLKNNQISDEKVFEMAVYSSIGELKYCGREISEMRTVATNWLTKCKYQALLIEYTLDRRLTQLTQLIAQLEMARRAQCNMAVLGISVVLLLTWRYPQAPNSWLGRIGQAMPWVKSPKHTIDKAYETAFPQMNKKTGEVRLIELSNFTKDDLERWCQLDEVKPHLAPCKRWIDQELEAASISGFLTYAQLHKILISRPQV